jgi:hypothetical protein
MQDRISNETGQVSGRTPFVSPDSMVSLHPATITIHTTIWGKRVLAVPHDTSERPGEHLS